mmetsp:Transcript_14092/g.43544  ORF Transcript_14092/g.43544 Transcript_14092/m.43544 type:complete len:218 (-) Transcript_14092:99-752(-)
MRRLREAARLRRAAALQSGTVGAAFLVSSRAIILVRLRCSRPEKLSRDRYEQRARGRRRRRPRTFPRRRLLYFRGTGVSGRGSSRCLWTARRASSLRPGPSHGLAAAFYRSTGVERPARIWSRASDDRRRRRETSTTRGIRSWAKRCRRRARRSLRSYVLPHARGSRRSGRRVPRAERRARGRNVRRRDDWSTGPARLRRRDLGRKNGSESGVARRC